MAGYRIVDVNIQPVKACCQFPYKGMRISISTILTNTKVVVFSDLLGDSRIVAELDTAEQAIEYIDKITA